MGWIGKTLCVLLGLTIGSGCKNLQPGEKVTDKVFKAPDSSVLEPESETETPTPDTPPAETVQAKLAGYPEAKSPNAQYEISVTGVAEYKWKVGASATECRATDGYSDFVPAATPIKIDLAARAESPAIVAVCVLGKSASGETQNFPSMATWVWTPELPTMTDQIDLIDGQNEIKIIPKVTSGNWLIVRSRESLNAMPEDGKEYTVNQPLGNGTVMVAGPMAEFVDKSVKNEESWNYTFFAYTTARRYSIPLTRGLTLSKQELLWVPKSLIQPGQLGLEARANNKRYVCRSRHFVDGENRGIQAGAMDNPADLKAGSCNYEYGGVVFRSTAYDVLMANKGNPADLVRWIRSSADATATAIPNGSIVAGTDDTGATVGPELFICLGVNAQFPGKAGAHLPNGCRSYVGNNNGTPAVNATFDVLAFK
ncbi:DUF3421 domain-containing protein [Oligoflexus tunisiensis]|uniref:DUF3421 domain-containing protein n=1 Tax=Oligoflexus tunisiensis TaxID=708132 RepID=UPI00114CDE70|nr:DUF3421 domain-containing protein [Oligoflexus tunisiensis]